jgi:uncharacterized protein (TIGR00369 family)
MTDSPERSRTYHWRDPMLSAGAARQMSGLDFMLAILRGEIPIAPIGATMGFELVEVEHGRVVFAGEPQEFHYNPIGVVHGGLAATALDSALGCTVQTTLPAGTGYTTAELHINYVRAMTVKTGRVTCEGKIIHSGRQMAIAEARLIDAGGKLYALGTTTCLIFPLPPEA